MKREQQGVGQRDTPLATRSSTDPGLALSASGFTHEGTHQLALLSVLGKGVLRVPLHPHRPCPRIRDHRLDDSIAGSADNGEPLAHTVDGLMVVAGGRH